MIHLFTQMSAVTRIGTFFLSWFVIWIPIAIPLIMALKWQPLTPLTPSQKLPLLASLYAIAPILLGAFAGFEPHLFGQYGLKWDLQILSSGLVGIGISLLGLVTLFSFQQLRGWSLWQTSAIIQFRNAIVPGFLIGLWISITEELVFRGFVLNQLLTLLPLWGAAIASSVIFALLHLVWEQHETSRQLPGLFLMGMVLVIARWANQGWLGLAIGLHAGWVGGMISLDTAQIIKYNGQAPSWFTGFANKPLAGLSGLGLMVLTGGLIYCLGVVF